MAVCNIFNTLKNTTGTFLTFSQYMEDLTMAKSSNGTYKVVPSKFVAIEYKNPTYNNTTFPKLFTEYLENGIAVYKNEGNDNYSSNIRNIFKSLFWDTIQSKLSIPNDCIHYIGDINIQSYNEVDGMGYSEIYCHIPNEAPKVNYELIYEEIKEGGVINIPNFDENRNPVYLEGFEDQPTYELSDSYTYLGNREYAFKEDGIDKRVQEYNINLVIVLYNVITDTQTIEDIPLGIYITGLIKNDKTIGNTITKYVSDDSVYNAGTSYGLRICSRYIASSIKDKITVKETQVTDDNYIQLSKALSEMSISQTKMDEVVNNIANYDKNFKETLANIKNNQVNVPYIREYSGEQHWFVNGKDMGALNITIATADNASIENLWKIE